MADKRQARTRYRVLRANGEAWVEDGPLFHAHSADDALRQAAALRAESDVEPSGVYVAVPERSWRPVAITTKTTTVVSLGVLSTATGAPAK